MLDHGIKEKGANIHELIALGDVEALAPDEGVAGRPSKNVGSTPGCRGLVVVHIFHW